MDKATYTNKFKFSFFLLNKSHISFLSLKSKTKMYRFCWQKKKKEENYFPVQHTDNTNIYFYIQEGIYWLILSQLILLRSRLPSLKSTLDQKSIFSSVHVVFILAKFTLLNIYLLEGWYKKNNIPSNICIYTYIHVCFLLM